MHGPLRRCHSVLPRRNSRIGHGQFSRARLDHQAVSIARRGLLHFQPKLSGIKLMFDLLTAATKLHPPKLRVMWGKPGTDSQFQRAELVSVPVLQTGAHLQPNISPLNVRI